ncbi:MAG: monofunctional biosynthetic peptidoglycan transglycosylase [Deltaproteobacteria bacterium]
MKKTFLILLALIAVPVILYLVFIPDVSTLRKNNPKRTSMMRYREAQWIAKGQRKKISHVWTPYSGISPYLVKAVIIAEDDKFWRHEGFDFEAMQKAVEKDIKAGRLKAGGSTISQQLAKNLYLTPEKSVWRKLKEAVITWKIERTLSKRRIIELYLNVVEWGDGVFGVEAAARRYFGKSAYELTPMDAARMAVVLPNPRRLLASGDQRYVNARANIIYNIMVRRGIVAPEFDDEDGGEGTQASPLTSQPVPDPASSNPAEPQK